jgi:hypothetical protein
MMFIMNEWNRRKPKEGQGVVAWKGEECHHQLQLKLVQIQAKPLRFSGLHRFKLFKRI